MYLDSNAYMNSVEQDQAAQNKMCVSGLPFNPLPYNPKNIVGKGENAGNQHFLLFPQCFLPFP